MKELLGLYNVECYTEKADCLIDYNLTVFPGELVWILGKSDSGIQTVMSILTDGAEIDSGVLYYKGTKCANAKLPVRGNDICMIDNKHMMVPELSILDNMMIVTEGKSFFSLFRKEKMQKIVTEIMEKIGIHRSPFVKFDDLNRKEQMLLCLEKARLQKCGLIVVDMNNIDLLEEERDEIWNAVRQAADNGISMLFFSERPDLYVEKADKVQLMWKGRDIWQCSHGSWTDDLYRYMEMDWTTEIIPDKERVRAIVYMKGSDWEAGMTWKEYLLYVSRRYRTNWEKYIGLPLESKLRKSNKMQIAENGIVFIPYDSAQLLPENLSLGENLALCVKNRVGKGILRVKNDGMMELLVEDYKKIIENTSSDLQIADLSYVERKILSIFRWLLIHPDLIFMENPLWGMDMEEVHLFYHYLCKLEHLAKHIIVYDRNLYQNPEMPKKIIDEI